MQRITKVVGWTIDAKLSRTSEVGIEDPSTGLSAKSSVTASLGIQYQNQKTSVTESSKSTEEWRRVTRQITFAPQSSAFKVVYWSLVDSYTLQNSDRKEVDRWEVVLPRRIRDSFPKKLPGMPED